MGENKREESVDITGIVNKKDSVRGIHNEKEKEFDKKEHRDLADIDPALAESHEKIREKLKEE